MPLPSEIMDTDLAAVPAKTVSEVAGGGTLLVHQQQTGKQLLELQWDHSDLQRGGGGKTSGVTRTHQHHICVYTCSTGTHFGPWFLFVL